MKIAMVGKGGSGKTTLARRRHRVLAIDGDPNLALTLGMSRSGADLIRSIPPSLVESVATPAGQSSPRLTMDRSRVLGEYAAQALVDFAGGSAGLRAIEAVADRLRTRIAPGRLTAGACNHDGKDKEDGFSHRNLGRDDCAGRHLMTGGAAVEGSFGLAAMVHPPTGRTMPTCCRGTARAAASSSITRSRVRATRR